MCALTPFLLFYLPDYGDTQSKEQGLKGNVI